MGLQTAGEDTEQVAAWDELRRELEDTGTVRAEEHPRRPPRKRAARKARQ